MNSTGEHETLEDRTGHPQILVTVGAKRALIDVEIAGLIGDLWHIEIGTLNSCQDNDGAVWIEFATVEDGELFLDAILSYDEDPSSLYNRALFPRTGDDPATERDQWCYDVYPCDDNVDETIVGDTSVSRPRTPHTAIRFTLSIRFPRDDLPVVTQRLQANVARLGGRQRFLHFWAISHSRDAHGLAKRWCAGDTP